MSKQKFAPGEYYIGDLCYVMTNDDWQRFISEVEEDDLSTFTINGTEYQVWYSSTAYGDGEYNVMTRTELIGTCPVDSGSIGVISTKALDITNAENTGHGVTTTFTHSVAPEVDDGIFYIGTIVINTGDDPSTFLEVEDDEEFDELNFD